MPWVSYEGVTASVATPYLHRRAFAALDGMTPEFTHYSVYRTDSNEYGRMEGLLFVRYRLFILLFGVQIYELISINHLASLVFSWRRY